MIRAKLDTRLRAMVVARTPLFYAEGPSPQHDRPAHVRAGSGLAWRGESLVVVQDDALFLAHVDPKTGRATAEALPSIGGQRQFDKGRGNKMAKADLEAVCVFETGELVAFGSGSSPRRESVVLEDELVAANGLYAALRAEKGFSGCELNVEGATVHAGDLVLFNRGNGSPKDLACDASVRLAAAPFLSWLRGKGKLPPLRDVTRYELGTIDGVRLTFTDAAVRGGSLAYLAAAEESPDAIEDGPVAGTALGWITGDEVRYCVIEERGEPFREKAEGLALDPRDESLAWIVLDKDEPDAPAELCRLELA